MLRVQRQPPRGGVGDPGQRLTDQVLGRTDLVGTVSSALAPLVNRRNGSARVSRPPGHGADPRHRLRALAAPLRPPTLQHLVHAAPASDAGRPGSRPRPPGVGLPHLLRRVHGAGHRPGPGRGLRAQRRRLLLAGRAPSAAGLPGCIRATWPSSMRSPGATWPRSPARSGPGATSSWPSRPAPTSSGRTTRSTVDGADAELVAEHTFDPAEYLVRLHRRGHDSRPTSRDGGRGRCPTRSPTTWPATCRPRTSA